MILRTTDGGNSWLALDAAEGSGLAKDLNTHWNFSALRFPALAGGRHGYAVGINGLISATRDGGETWAPLSRSLTVHQMNGVTFVNRDTGFAVGTNGLILRTVDGGGSWSPRPAVTGLDLHVVEFPTPRIGYVVSHSGLILKTRDGGNSWDCLIGLPESCPQSVIEDDFNGISFPNGPDTGYAVASGGHILKTTDGGQSWTAQNSGTDARLMYVDCVETRNCVAVGDLGTLLKTADGGANWIQRTGCGSQNLNAVHFPVPGIGYVAGTNGRICKSEDGGETWTPRLSGTGKELRALRFFDASRGFAVGNDGVILSTADGGETWAENASGTNISLQSVFATESSVAVVGSAGIILTSTWSTTAAVRPSLRAVKGRRKGANTGWRVLHHNPETGGWVDLQGRAAKGSTRPEAR